MPWLTIEWGTTRVVILAWRWAFKFPRPTKWRLFLYGLLGNMQEAEFSSLSEKFCPVVFHIPGGFLTAMKRAKPLTEEEYAKLDIKSFRRDCNMYIFVEHKHCTFGKLNGKIVAVDYGS